MKLELYHDDQVARISPGKANWTYKPLKQSTYYTLGKPILSPDQMKYLKQSDLARKLCKNSN
jgi:hypothetical protein